MRHDIIAVMSAIWSKMGLFPYINLENVFMCTDQHATKETQKSTPVHSITRTVWKSQSFPSRAEIDSITSGMTAISGDKGMKERHTQNR